MIRNSDKFRKVSGVQVAKAAYGPSERVYMCTQSSMIHPLEYSYTHSHIKYHPAAVQIYLLLLLFNSVNILSIQSRYLKFDEDFRGTHSIALCPMASESGIPRHPQLVCNSLWSPQDSFHFKTLIHLLTTIIPTDILDRFFQFSHFQESSSFVSSIS